MLKQFTSLSSARWAHLVRRRDRKFEVHGSTGSKCRKPRTSDLEPCLVPPVSHFSRVTRQSLGPWCTFFSTQARGSYDNLDRYEAAQEGSRQKTDRTGGRGPVRGGDRRDQSTSRRVSPCNPGRSSRHRYHGRSTGYGAPAISGRSPSPSLSLQRRRAAPIP